VKGPGRLSSTRHSDLALAAAGLALSPACAAGFVLAVTTVVANRKHAALVLGFTSLLLGSPASAQPPGLSPPGGSAPPQHAVPPIPYGLPSPLPTIPPPSRNAPMEPTVGFSMWNGKFTARVDADGSIHFDDGDGGVFVGVDPIVGLFALLSFDTSDSAMRAAREDPYLAEKLRIMELTREERWEMRRRHDVVVMQRALDDLPRYLDAVWRQRRWSAPERRRVLFALWDEAAEDGNELMREGGAEARRLIEEFIAYRIPPGSRDGFRTHELVRLNRIRHSRQSFAPYTTVAHRRALAERLARAATDSAAERAASNSAAPVLVAMRGFWIR
jgi:hypothetical protein